MVRIILQGCCGKMGRMVTQCSALFPDLEIVAGVDRLQSDPPMPYPVYSQADEVQEEADVIVDFSRPEGMPLLLATACQRHLNLVLATTGLTEEENRMADRAAGQIAIFQAANLSVGIKAMQRLLTEAAAILGEDSDIEIVETHHNQKVDAPSGTALALADTIRQALDGDKPYVFGRHGRSCRRTKGEIGIHALRGGTVAGEHEVFFFGQDEVLSIKHHAASRQVFAMGALKAARFLDGRTPGRYGMDDLLQADKHTLAFYEGLTLFALPTSGCGPLLERAAREHCSPGYTCLAAGQLLCVVPEGKAAAFHALAGAQGLRAQYKPVFEACFWGDALPEDLASQALCVLDGAMAPLALAHQEHQLRLWLPLPCRAEAEPKLKTLIS